MKSQSLPGARLLTRLRVGLSAMALLVAAHLAPAGMVVPMTVEEMSALSHEIVHGTVEASETRVFAGKIYTRHRVAVHDVLKGSSSRRGNSMDVVTIGGTIAGTVTSVAVGTATLDEGEEVILFLGGGEESIQRLDAQFHDAFNRESPLVSERQIVGGPQGKFNVVRTALEHEAPGGRRVSVETTRVVRPTIGRSSDVRTSPRLEDFTEAVRTVANPTAGVRRNVRSVAGVQGLSVATPDPNAHALRAFDPIAPIREQGPFPTEIRITPSQDGAPLAPPVDPAARPRARSDQRVIIDQLSPGDFQERSVP